MVAMDFPKAKAEKNNQSKTYMTPIFVCHVAADLGSATPP